VHQLFVDFEKACDSVMKKILFNNLLELDIATKPVRVNKKRLNETYSKISINKNLINFLFRMV